MQKFITYDDAVIPVHHPRVILETAAVLGADRSALLAAANLTEDLLGNPEARITYKQFGTLVSRALSGTGDPGLGLVCGKNLKLPQMGALGLGLMSSATIGQALELALRHGPALNPALQLELTLSGTDAQLFVREAIPVKPFEVFTTEMLLSAFDTQGRILFGGPLPVKRLRLAYAEPAHSARYREFYDVPVLFGQGVTAVEFDSALLAAPIGFPDPATQKLAERLCAEQLETSVENTGVVEQTRRVLDAARAEPPNLERVARTLQVSGRTLRRNLKRVGTSYQRILDAWRRERADDWLVNTHLSQQQMAQKLGFSDVRSFRRAYKRWTGQSPSAPRARK